TNNSSLARRRIGAYQGGYVGDDDSRFGQQPQLQKQRAGMLENFEKGGPLKELRDDDGDEARLASRQAPDLFEHGLRNAERGVKYLEVRPLVREPEPTWLDAWVGTSGRHVDGTKAVVHLLGEPQCVGGRLVD